MLRSLTIPALASVLISYGQIDRPPKFSTYELGFSLNGTTFIYKVFDDSVLVSEPITRKAFIMQGMGVESSRANPADSNLFERFAIRDCGGLIDTTTKEVTYLCFPLDDLPKLPDDTTFAPGAEPVLPSETSPAATEEPPAESCNPEPEIELPGVEIESDVKGVLLLPAGMGNRTGLAREEALRDRSGGMGKATEASVVKALDWLKANQLADGSWGPNKVAMTGLSLLTFLAHGEITSSKEYGWTVERSIRFLLSKQREDGTFTGVDTQAGPYEQWAADPSAEQVGPNERRTAPGARQTELRAVSSVPDAGQVG